MKGYEAPGEVFARKEEVAEVSAAEVAAGIAAATFVEGALVVPVRRLANVRAAFIDERRPVPSFPSGHDAVEQVNAGRYRRRDVFGAPHAHKVAYFIGGE